MQPPPVAVEPHFLSRQMKRSRRLAANLLQMKQCGFLIFAILIVSGAVFAEEAPRNQIHADNLTPPPGYLARILLNKPEEVETILKRAETYYLESHLSDKLPPIVFVLHGPEVEIFNRNNYQHFKPIIDLAARLQAFKVVDIRICQTQMQAMGEKEELLFPFVGTVPLGSAEIERLLSEERYQYY